MSVSVSVSRNVRVCVNVILIASVGVSIMKLHLGMVPWEASRALPQSLLWCFAKKLLNSALLSSIEGCLSVKPL